MTGASFVVVYELAYALVPFHAVGGAMVRPMINKRFSTVTVTADHNPNVTLLLCTITPPVQLS